jgi:hypothetical protein
MSELSQKPVDFLFTRWRSHGDAAAGQAMAQRFSDWYYAVTTCRLGDAHGRGPLQRACVRFQQGILTVTTPAELTDWSHGLLMEEVRMAGGRIGGGDFPNQLTGGRSPSELLRQVAGKLSPDQLSLLAIAYDANVAQETVTQKAEGLGGYPFAVLEARLACKRALRDGAGIAFAEVPAAPNLDLGPLPLYEAGRMAKEAEEASFEKWMLTDMPLCRDIAEFGVFAQAIRAGALKQAAAKAPSSPSAPPAAAAPKSAPPRPSGEEEEAPAAPARSRAIVPLAAAAVVGLLGLVVLLGAAAWLIFGWG